MIVSQFDEKYIKWGELFLSSLNLNWPNDEVVFNTVNLNNQQIDILKSLYSTIYIENEKINNVTPQIMANRKPGVFLDIAKKYKNKEYIFIDIDMLIRKPLNHLLNYLKEADAALLFRSGLWEGKVYEHLKIASGIVVIKYSGIPLLIEWLETSNRNNTLYGKRYGEWFWDQVTLLHASRITPLKYAIIDEQLYINNTFSSDAVIWSANRPNKNLLWKLFNHELSLLKERK